MRELKVGDIVEHVHPGCPNDGGVGVIAMTEPYGEDAFWYHVRWIVEPRNGFHKDGLRFIKSELTLRIEP